METQMIHTRVDQNLKQAAEKVFSNLGINTSDAIRMFLAQVTLKQGMPFEVKVPNAETRKAIEDARKGKNIRRFSSAAELIKFLENA